MRDKLNAIPERIGFAIGITLILVSSLLLYLLSLFFNIGPWTQMVVGVPIWFIATLFIVSAADKRHGINKKKK
ncbi:hypothetical protein A8F94_15615 [Bacillus sp. FJAT-27225]|uniref:hypothetical protein n=1 Tax=Bacillus sp. FJAT-27225 TaxID=1743144 RepID=UPI00080C2690|nr:hypothetical protein [Bacillus sp. FJAT-27225]OCA84149.1 hypothetical protein A8F94_15615 [Bacillus sp. FJAT-27225]